MSIGQAEYRVADGRFNSLTFADAQIERLWTGGRWCEGPAYFAAGRYLIWSDIPNDRVLRFDEASGLVSVFRHPCRYENGHCVDREGRLISCEHQGRCVSRTERDGSRTVLVDRYRDCRLNSPNDVVVKSDGSVWFTDPTYGIDSDYEGVAAASEIGAANVYRFDPASGAMAAVATDMVRPNGLAFSPDERLLYVSDTGRSHKADMPYEIRSYPVSADGRELLHGTQFAIDREACFDGLRVDHNGNVWTSAGNGVRCHAADGTLLGTLVMPEAVANVCFGGAKGNRLFICATTSLFAVSLNTRGCFAQRA